jgi:hypothetical protein
MSQTRMARKLGVECPGAMNPIMNCGDLRALIFVDDQDLQHCAKTLGEAWVETRWLDG